MTTVKLRSETSNGSRSVRKWRHTVETGLNRFFLEGWGCLRGATEGHGRLGLAASREVANLPESDAADAPIRAATTAKNTSFRYMSAAGLLLCQSTEGKVICGANVENQTPKISQLPPRLASLVVVAAAAAR